MEATAETKEPKYLYNVIVEKIREMIRQGELQVGDKLPPERTLAERFKVSRNSIRQAVQALAERKVLESRQGDGTYVRGLDESVLVDSLASALRMRQEQLREVLEFRLLMEPQIAALATRNITQAELDRLKVIVCDQQRKMLTGSRDPDLDASFHMALADASRNKVIRKVMDILNDILNESRAEFLQNRERKTASVVGHLRIIDAIEKRDPEAAFRAMKEHLSEVEKLVLGSDAETTPGGELERSLS